MNDKPWEAIAKHTGLLKHNFNSPREIFFVTSTQIKEATRSFSSTNEREVRILCKQDSREDRPEIFREKNLFLLPIKNGNYAVVRGEGYVDIPEINSAPKNYKSKLEFKLETSSVGNSEMQHLDFAFAAGLFYDFLEDKSLFLTIRGRKYTPHFSFRVGECKLDVSSVQTEVDAGYEGKNQVVLFEAKASKISNTIIRQLYYPYLQWQLCTKKPVKTLFFQAENKKYFLWEFKFNDIRDYNSIELVRSESFRIHD
jgi:hypothetical protein